MQLSAFALETLASMGLLAALFVTVLHLVGYPVRPLFLLVRNTALAIAFLRLYNLVFSAYGLSIGVNPLTVMVLALGGVEGFAAMNVVALWL